jgi:hypothetical protein
MMQLELYVSGVERAERLFSEAFGYRAEQASAGWRFLSHPTKPAIMLYDPEAIPEANAHSHWQASELNQAGVGIELVMLTDDATALHTKVTDLGYTCSALYTPPWQSLEFTFNLPEGYLIRVKQPPEE